MIRSPRTGKARPVSMSIRLPPELHEQLRRQAFDSRGSMNEIIVRAVERALNEETSHEHHDQSD